MNLAEIRIFIYGYWSDFIYFYFQFSSNSNFNRIHILITTKFDNYHAFMSFDNTQTEDYCERNGMREYLNRKRCLYVYIMVVNVPDYLYAFSKNHVCRYRVMLNCPSCNILHVGFT